MSKLNFRNILRSIFIPALLLFVANSLPAQFAVPAEADIVIYGGTSAAITAAVQAKQMGKSVVIVSPDKHLGGMTSGGLGWTDSGNAAVVGGLSREFYHRVWQHYQRPESWNWQRPEEFKNQGQGSAARDNKAQTMWVFEPHVAEQIFDAWVAEAENSRRAKCLARSRAWRRKIGQPHQVDQNARRQHLSRDSVYRRHLRRRFDGRRRRFVSSRPRIATGIRRKIQRRADRRAASSALFRQAGRSVCHSRRSQKRPAAAYQF